MGIMKNQCYLIRLTKQLSIYATLESGSKIVSMKLSSFDYLMNYICKYEMQFVISAKHLPPKGKKNYTYLINLYKI